MVGLQKPCCKERGRGFTITVICIIISTLTGNVRGQCFSWPNCDACDPTTNECTQCTNSPYYGFLPNRDGCDDCSLNANCVQCNYMDTCTMCDPANYAPKGDGSGACGACDPNCGSCTSTAAGLCDPYQCYEGYAYNPSTQTCQACQLSCTSCATSGPGNCDTCLVGEGLIPGGSTVPNDCQPCTTSNCATCYNNNGICETCLTGYTLQSGACVAVTTAVAPPTPGPTTAQASPTARITTAQVQTTAAPTTAVPPTAAPTTAVPPTAAPTTAAPQTAAPTTAAPQTAAPTTAAQTTAVQSGTTTQFTGTTTEFTGTTTAFTGTTTQFTGTTTVFTGTTTAFTGTTTQFTGTTTIFKGTTTAFTGTTTEFTGTTTLFTGTTTAFTGTTAQFTGTTTVFTGTTTAFTGTAAAAVTGTVTLQSGSTRTTTAFTGTTTYGLTGTMRPCPTGCATCTAANQCTQCSTGYFLSGSTCLQCATGCTTCTAAECTGCETGYVLVSGACQLAGTTQGSVTGTVTQGGGGVTTPSPTTCFIGCVSCTSSGECAQCDTGYVLNSNSQCIACPTPCSSCTPDGTCTGCDSGYVLNGGNCLACPDNCTTCTTTGTCTGCESGHVLTAGACPSCPQGCSTCTMSQTCTVCSSGYVMSSGTCQQCATGCTTCTSGGGDCGSCGIGYVLVSGACQPCPTGCATCTAANQCASCTTGYVLSGSTCLQCPNGCSACVGSTCIQCRAGYVLVLGVCQACTTGCTTCTSAGVCQVCNAGYRLVNGQCEVICTLPNCAICSSTNPSTQCATCDSGYGLNPSTSLCEPCTNQPNCLRCTTTTACTTCSTSYTGPNPTGTPGCANCTSNCVNCLTAGAGKCNQCATGFILNTATQTCDPVTCPSPCQHGGTCLVYGSTAYCRCACGYTGSDCSQVDSRFFPFGTQNNDVDLFDTQPWCWKDDGYVTRTLPQDFMFGCTSYRQMHISANGFVSMRRTYYSWTPRELHTSPTNERAMIAPFWTDIDFRDNTGFVPGKVFYQCYSRDTVSSPLTNRQREVFDRSRQLVREKYNDYTFEPLMTCVITWWNGNPYPSYYYPNERLCLQLVLTSDMRTKRSYAMFIYLSFGSWQTYRFSSAYQGLRSFDGSIYNRMYTSFQSSAQNLPYICGNRGGVGMWFFRTSTESCEIPTYSPHCLCINWYYQQVNYLPQTLYWYIWYYYIPPCPCFMWQAWWDPRWIVDLRSFCAYSAFAYNYHGVECCYYRYGSQSLITYPSFAAGSMYFYHPYLLYYNFLQTDWNPRLWCCLYSNNCHLYYSVRPLRTCWGYVFPWWAIFRGDPYITTLDELEYTFNGCGEYWLMHNSHMWIQGRTERAWDKNNQPVEAATVFTAIAAQYQGNDSNPEAGAVQLPAATLHVQLNAARTGLEIMINGITDRTAWYNSVADGEVERYNSLAIYRLNGSLIARFPNGFGMAISVDGLQLRCITQVPRPADDYAPFAGLLGNVNGNPNDDLQPRSGAALPSTASEEQIYDGFGETWRLRPGESKFYYKPGTNTDTYACPGFRPVFGIPSDTPQDLLNYCDGLCKVNNVRDNPCYLDCIRTKGNSATATATRDANVEYQRLGELFSRNIINLNVSEWSVRWNVSTEYTLDLVATDSDSTQMANLELLTNFTSTTFTVSKTAPGEWTFKWTPTSRSRVLLSFTAKDSTEAVSPVVEIQINLCDCSGHGECQWDLYQDGYNSTQRFTLVQCVCNDYLNRYTGSYCDEDFNACLDEPCGAGSVCTDLTPEQHAAQPEPTKALGYSCGACLPGFQNRLGKCGDIDECEEGTHNCNPTTQICNNTIPSFTCICREGYRAPLDNPKTCIDINECTDGTAMCGQKCTNLPGSFECDCAPGYERNASDPSQCYIPAGHPDPCGTGAGRTPCTGGHCEDGTCYCRIGYVLSSGTCIPFDECSLSTTQQCRGGGTCVDTPPGTYSCQCPAGYRLDKDDRTCIACEPGYWGVGCQVCNCTRDCDPVTGCRSCDSPYLTGPNCDQLIPDICTSFNPCGSPNAVCQNTPTGYNCVCQTWYLPVLDQCRQADACQYLLVSGQLQENSTVPRCQNGGACQNGTTGGPGEYICNCRPGYTGRLCETNIDDCAVNNCLNGGSCEDGVPGYGCVCAGGYFGERCQYPVAPLVEATTPGPSTSTTTAAVRPSSPGSSGTPGPPGSTSTAKPPGSSTSGSSNGGDDDNGLSNKEIGIIVGSIGGALALALTAGLCCYFMRAGAGTSRLPPPQPPPMYPSSYQMPSYGAPMPYANFAPPQTRIVPVPVPRYRAAPMPFSQARRYNPYSRGYRI